MYICPVAGIRLSKRGSGYRVAAWRRAVVTRGRRGNASAAAAGDNSRGRKNQYHCHPEGRAPRTASHARGKRHNHQEEKRCDYNRQAEPPPGIEEVRRQNRVRGRGNRYRDALSGAGAEDVSVQWVSRCDRATRLRRVGADRKSTRLNSSHLGISYAVFCLKKKK